MKIFKSISSLQNFIKEERQKKHSIGFVPTMGALHEGHLSLIRRCRRENDVAIISIFINPTQFGPNEDLKKYPRQKKNDEMLAKNAKIDIIFYPSERNMYPKGYLTYVNVDKLSTVLCGKSRPCHFRGVTTIVSKLLNIVSPDIMYLGQKDAQQAIIIKQMVKDLNFMTKIKICPIVREKDGIALSSRNIYLNKKQREEAAFLFKSLNEAKKSILSGEHSAKKICKHIINMIINNTSSQIDYVECVNADNLNPVKIIEGKIMIALATKFGKTRLIDNIIVSV